MDQFLKNYIDKLWIEWQKQVSITQDTTYYKATNIQTRKTVDIANAKAEQILDDLVLLYQNIKKDAPTIAGYIHGLIKSTRPQIAQFLAVN